MALLKIQNSTYGPNYPQEKRNWGQVWKKIIVWCEKKGKVSVELNNENPEHLGDLVSES